MQSWILPMSYEFFQWQLRMFDSRGAESAVRQPINVHDICSPLEASLYSQGPPASLSRAVVQKVCPIMETYFILIT